MHTLNKVYLAMINNMWDIEDQLINSIPWLLEEAHNTELKKTLTAHLDETMLHKARIGEILTHHSVDHAYERDMAFQTLLQDAIKDLAFIDEENVKDAFILASCQTVEHIEVSRYSTLTTWAEELGDSFGLELLSKTLHEEEAALAKLAAVGDGGLFSMGVHEKATLTEEKDQPSI